MSAYTSQDPPHAKRTGKTSSQRPLGREGTLTPFLGTRSQHMYDLVTLYADFLFTYGLPSSQFSVASAHGTDW